MVRKITIPYSPRNWAKQLHNCTKRWMVLVLHRRAGKTTAVINHLQRDAIRIPKSVFAYIAPTYKQAKRIAWKLVKDYSTGIPGIKYNEAELTVTYPNGSILYLLGSEDIDSLRGIGLWGCGLDENSQQPSNLFSEVISKCLADHLGYCIWLGTPKGKNQFHRTYQTALKSEDYLAVFKTIDDSLRDEEGETIDNLRIALEDDRKLVALGEMTEEEFLQEWYCSFEAAIKGAYYTKEISKLKKDNRYRHIPHDPALLVHDVWDLGTGNKLAIGFYQKVMNEVRMIDYWEGSNKDGIPQAVQACKEKTINKGYLFGRHFAPHDIRATEIGTGKTRFDTALELGWEFEEVPKISIENGIDKGKLFFHKLWVDSKNCEPWLDAVVQYKQEWDEKRGVFKDKPYHDWTSHPGDVHRYASLVEDQMTNELSQFEEEMEQNEQEYIANPYK